MASVFLSYSRDDLTDATALARILDRAGHQVWWDSDLVSGEEFAGEIESALERADVVVVLWSKSAARSPWVRDEAAVGRDENRLLPLSIDGGDPPIGFRQFHTIDLSGWNRRAKHPGITKLLTAIGRRFDSAEPRATPATEHQPSSTGGALSRWRWVALAVLMLALVVAAVTMLLPSHEKEEQPIVAVLPFADLSPKRDQAYFTEGIGEEILTALGSQSGIRVIGRTSASMLGKEAADVRAIRQKLGVTHILEGSARVAGRELRLNVRLVSTADGTQVWAEEYERALTNVFAVQDEIAGAVTQRLKGSLINSAIKMQRPGVDAYQLYLAARALTRERNEPSLRQALQLAQQVIRTTPEYAPGHALYAELMMHLSNDPLEYGKIPVEQARALGLPHARRAIELAPQLADGYAALGLLQRGEDDVRPLQRAVALDPARAELRVWLGIHQNLLGANGDALRNYEIASRVEPLWPVPVNRFISALAATGRLKEAFKEVDNFLARGGSPAQVHRFRAFIHEVNGDLAPAAVAGRAALKLEPSLPFVSERLAKTYVALGLPELAAAVPVPVRSQYTRLMQSADWPQIRNAALSTGSSVWLTADGNIAVLSLARDRDWDALVRLYDQRPQGDRNRCLSRFELSAALVLALRARHRTGEARKVLRCYQDRIAKEAAGSVRAPGMSRGELAFQQAQLAALQGRRDIATRSLRNAIALGWRGDIWGSLTAFPAFDALHQDGSFELLQRQLSQLLQAQRARLLRQL